MKWAFSIRRKLRVAIFMAILMLFIILFSLIGSYNIKKISSSFKSIYEDRLIPATDLYYLADKIDNRRHELLLFLHTETSDPQQIKNYIGHTDSEINALLKKYENTHLVRAESEHLRDLKVKLGNVRRDEKLLLAAASDNRETAAKMYLNSTLPLFQELSNHLMELIRVQTEVGKDLLKDSQSISSSTDFISSLQIVIAIILGLMIIILVTTSKEFVVKSSDFRMN